MSFKLAKRVFFICLIAFFSVGNVNATEETEKEAACTKSPNAVAGFIPNQTCQPVTVTLSSVSHIPAFGGPNNIPANTTYFVNWGDGDTQTYTTTVDNEGVPAFMQTHTYGAVDTDCAYSLTFEVSNACGADFITGTVNVHDTDEIGLAITQDYEICEGYGGTFIFTDASAMNCLAPPFGDANDEDRTIRWDYGTGGSSLPGVTAGGNNASGAVYQDAAYTVTGAGSNSLAVVIPGASTVGRAGEYFEVTMYNWNSCNRYDDPGIAGAPADLINGDNAPVSITARITVIASPAPPVAPDRDYCFGSVGPLTATAGSGGTLRWYENATLDAQGLIATGTQVSTGATFGHGQVATGTYTYWVTEILPATLCEGPATEVTLNIREDLNISDPISGNANVCPGETGLIYSLPNPPPVQAVGGATTYNWTVPAGWTITAGQGTEQITVTSSSSAGSGNIGVSWEFTTAPNCTSPTVTTPVTVNVLPAGNISGNQTICEGNAPNLTINLTQGVGNSGPFEVDYTDGTNNFTETLAFGSNSVTPSVDPPGGGTTTYTITEIRDLATNGCSVTAPHANITGSAAVVVRSALNLTDVISGPSDVCPGDMVSFSLPNPPPSVDGFATEYKWSLPNNSGSNLGTITSGDLTETINVTVGNNTGTKRVRVRWRYQDNSCPTPWQTYFVEVNIQPQAEISGDQSICLGDNPVITFSNLVGVGGAGPFDIDYSPDGGTTIFTATNIPIAGGNVNAPAPAAAGNYTYTIREIRDLGANGCVTTAPSANISGSANVIVKETLNNSDVITGPSNVCANENSVTFSLPSAPASQPFGGATEYIWSVPADWTIDSGQGSESIEVTVGPSTGPGRTVSVVWQYTNSPNCASNVVNTTVTVDPGPSVATAGPDLDYCSSSTLVSVGLGGNTPGIGTGMWSQVSGPGAFVATITDPTDPNTTVSIANTGEAGVYIFEWAITSGTCPASTEQVTVRFGATPTPSNAGSDDTTCGLTYSLSGNAIDASIEVGEWTLSAGPGTASFDDDADPTSDVTVSTFGTYTFQWSHISGLCTPSDDLVQITFDEPATVTLDPANITEFCFNNLAPNSFTLAGDFGGSASSATWGVAGNAGTLGASSTAGNTVSASYTPAAGDIGNTLTFTLTTDDPASPACGAVFATVDVLIKQQPNVTSATTASICNSQSVSYTPTSDVGSATFSWQVVANDATISNFSSGVQVGAISDVLVNSGTATGTVTYRISASDNGCTGPTIDLVVTVNPTAQILPDKTTETICSGGTTSVDLDATMPVTGTTYTWTVVDNPDVTGETADLTGAAFDIAQTLTNTSTTAQTVTYSVTASANGCAGNMQDIVITVQPEPSFTNSGTETICSDDQLNFTPTGPVSGTNYNWTVTAAGPNISGQSTGTNSGLINDQLANSGTTPETITYTVTPVVNGCPGSPGTYVVTVQPDPSITNLPVGAQNLCSGQTFSFTPTTNITSGTVTYTWSTTNTGNITGVPTNGTGGVSHTINNTGTSVETVIYTITPSVNGCPGDDEFISVLVAPVANVSNATLTDVICNNDFANFTPTSDVLGATFSWTASLTAGTVTGFSATGTGAISEQLFNATATAGEVTYTITPSINGCNGAPSNFVVTVNPTPNITNPAGDLTDDICSNSNAVFTPTSSVAGTTYTWTASASSGNVIGFTPVGSGNINETIKNTGATTETLTYVITPSANSCAGSTVNFTVTVYPEPNISNAVSSLTDNICSGGTAAFTPVETVAGTTFNWTASVTSGAATGFSPAGTGSISDVITNSGIIDAEITYVYTVTANGCPGPTFSYVATVSPVPDITNLPATETICSETALNFSPTSSVAGTTYSWTSVDNPNVTGESAAGFGSITDNLTNNSFVQQTVVYTVTPIVNGCPGTAETYTVQIDPKPNVNPALSTATVCSGGTLNIPITGDVAGTTFNWTSVAGANITGNTGVGAGTITDALTNSGNTPQTVVYTITPEASGCAGDIVTLTVTVFPTPGFTNALSDFVQEICDNGTASFTPTGDVTGTTFNWTVAAPATISSANADFTAGFGSGAINHQLDNTGFNVEIVTYTITTTANGCPGATETFVVTVNPTANINNSPGNQTICSGDNFNYNPAGDVTGTTFTWTSSASSPDIVGNTSNGTGLIDDFLTNNGVNAQTVTYQITTTANGCTGDTETIVITVNPRPTVSPSKFSEEICSTETTDIDLVGNISFGTGTTFSWTITSAGPNIAGQSAASGASIAQTLTNSGSVTETVVYEVTPSANGCTGTALPITVTVYPTPVTSAITAVTGSDDGCVNSTNFYRVDGVSGTAGSSYTWSISPIDGNEPTITSFNNNAILDFGANPWSGTLSVVETSNGCDGVASVLAVESFPVPTVNPGVDGEICQGDSYNLGGAPTASGGSGTYNYQWTPASGLSDPFIANPVATPSSTVIYTLQVTDASTGCTATSQVQVSIILAPPQPFISVPNIAESPFMCEGEDLTLQSSTIGASSYQWYKDGLAIPGETNQTLTITGAVAGDAGDYQVQTFGPIPLGAPCESLLSPIQEVEVDPIPAKPTIAIVGSHPFCDNGANLVLLEANGAPTAVRYRWFFDDGSGYVQLAEQTDSYLVTSHTQSGDYKVVAIGAPNSECESAESDPITVTVHQSPTNPTWTGPSYSCSGETAALQLNFTAGTAPFTVDFSDDLGNNFNVIVNNGQDIFVAPTNTNTFPVVRTYTVTSVTDANGCPALSLGGNFQLEVRPKPTAPAIVGPTQVCTNETGVRYEVSPYVGGVDPNYNWTLPTAFGIIPGYNVVSGGGLKDTFIVLEFGNVPVNGDLELSITDNGCTGLPSILNINPWEPAIANAGPDPAPICVNDNVEIGSRDGFGVSNTASGGSGNYAYSWSPNIGLSSTTVANPMANPTTTTTYTVTITDNISGCPISTDDVVVTVNPLPVVTLSVINLTGGICSTAPAYTLTEGSPTGVAGTYSYTSPDPGITETSPGVFEYDPAVAGLGLHTIVYTFTDANGCTNSTSRTIEVYNEPNAALASFSDVCVDLPAFTLTGGTVNGVDIASSGGTYSYSMVGAGITEPVPGTFQFNPAVAGVGTHVITLNYTDNNGCPDTSPPTATIQVDPLPVVTLNPFPNQGVCNTSYTLVEGLVGGVTVAGGVYSELSGLLITETSPGVYEFDPSLAGVGPHTITYTYQDPTTGCINSANGVITVVDLPVISLAPLSNVGECTAPFVLSGGSPVDMNATPLETGTYSGTGVTEITPGVFQFDPAAAGVGVHLIRYDYIDEFGCTNTFDVQPITVEPVPFVVVGPIDDACVSETSVSLTSGSPAGGVYAGVGVTEPTPGVFEFNPSVAGVGTHIIDYTVTDANGCSTTEQGSIIVNALPTGTVSATGAFCNGGPLQFDLTGIAPFEIVFEDNHGNTFTESNAGNIFVLSVDPTQNTTYTLLSVQDRYGCINNAIAPSSAEVTITPVAAFTADPTQQILPGKTVTITNSTNPGGWTYTWDFGDGNEVSGTTGAINITHPDGSTTTGTIENPVHTYAVYGDYLISLNVTDGNCESSAVIPIVIEPLPPIVDFTYSVSEGCSPLTVDFTNLTEFADEDSYLWQFGEGEGFSNAQNPTYIYNNPGVFTVTLTAFNDLGIAVTETKELIIEVFEQPISRFTVRPTTIYLPDKPVFTTNLSFGGTSYLWDFGDGNTSDEFEPMHFYTEPGIYTISLTVSNGDCEDTHTIEEAVVVLNGGEIKVPTVFTPDPNGPNGGSVSLGTVENNVFIPLIEGAVEFRMEVYSRWGKLMFVSNSQTVGWDGYYKGKIAGQGVYLYKVEATFRDGEKITRVGDVTLLR